METEHSDQQKPAAWRNHPILAVLREGESFRQIAKQVEYCEIGWPQCYELGQPIRLYTERNQQ